MGIILAPVPGDVVLQGAIGEVPRIAPPVTGNPPARPPLTGTPISRPAKPDDGVVVGVVHLDDAPRTPPKPGIITGTVVAPTEK